MMERLAEQKRSHPSCGDWKRTGPGPTDEDVVTLHHLAARNGRSQGWTEQQMLSVDAGGNMIVARYFNVFADGSRTEGAGVVLFNDEGKLTRVRTLNNSGSTAMLPPT
jgi:hypothetical protein